MKYELTAYELSIINGAFVIVGALVGGLVSYWLSRLLANYNSKLSAAASLRTAFAKVVAGVKTGRLDSHAEISSAALASFDAHAIELERFRFYVKDKDGYNKACDEYENMISLRPINHGSNLHVTDFYIQKVNNILKYTKI